MGNLTIGNTVSFLAALFLIGIAMKHLPLAIDEELRAQDRKMEKLRKGIPEEILRIMVKNAREMREERFLRGREKKNVPGTKSQ